MVSATKDAKQDSNNHSHPEKDGFEPLLNETYAGKHLSDPIPEIKVIHILVRLVPHAAVMRG
jgi:hypothetical protein